MVRYNAIILGGGKSPVDKTIAKGNTDFNGKTLGRIVYESAREGYIFDKVSLVMETDENIKLRKGDVYVSPTYCKGAWQSGVAGIKAIEDFSHGYVMIASDLPFFNKNSMKGFMEKVKKNSSAGIIIPLIERNVNENVFPNRKRTYMPFQEGEFICANMGYVSSAAIENNEHLIDDITSTYQEKLKFITHAVGLLGLKNVLRSNHPKIPLIKKIPNYEKFFPRFSIEEVERIASEFSGVKVKIVDFNFPEAAYDIDNLRQLEEAKLMDRKNLENLV